MAKSRLESIEHQSVELEGIRYVILRETVFDLLCQSANLKSHLLLDRGASTSALDLDSSSLAQKLIQRRKAAGLSQAELARRAGVRPETLNRIERGRTTPDFTTIRKLVVAMNTVDRKRATMSISTNSCQETCHVDPM